MHYLKLSILLVLFLFQSLVFAQQKPNIIFILADDMGYSDMSWQGAPIQTPHLDRLAEQGMFLDRNYVQPQCSPTRVAFLTGNYPYRYGLHEHIVMASSYTGIPGKVKTIAEKMKEGGYKTAVIGKWHVGGHKQSYLPHNQGFDHSFVCINGAISYWNYTHAGRSDLIRNGKKVYAPSMKNSEAPGNEYSTYMWANEAVDLINKHDKRQPLFMYLAFNAPHHPLHAPRNVLDKYSEERIAPYWSGQEAEKGRTAKGRKHYMAMVDAMDNAIGKVIKAIDSNGMSANTMIVFCSDNGGIIEADNRPLRSIKGDSFEGGVRVPGIVVWPGKIQPGTTSSELVYIADWYPTFARMAGLNIDNETLDGINALPLLEGGKGKRDAVPVISAGRHALINSRFSLVGSTENYWHSINNGFSEFQLYDLDADVSQNSPTDSFPEIQDTMKQRFLSHFRDVHRGYFNWDIKYARYRSGKYPGDHNFDAVVNDLPEMQVNYLDSSATVTISPVSNMLTYKLLGSAGGEKWKELAEFICREDAENYTFSSLPAEKKWSEFRIQAMDHFGLPMRDGFSLDNQYTVGTLYPESEEARLKEILPAANGFLPVADVSGGSQVKIIDKNLEYNGFPTQGGALQLKSTNQMVPTFLTRYFLEPHSKGRICASLLVQFRALEAESMGEINWLVQNGWNGPTAKQVSLVFQNDGVYFKQADPPEGEGSIKWLGAHDNEVVCLVFDFGLGATGKDTLNVYLNPSKMDEFLKPTATCYGELTFDRLQMKLSGRTGSVMKFDEIHVGRRMEEVFYP